MNQQTLFDANPTRAVYTAEEATAHREWWLRRVKPTPVQEIVTYARATVFYDVYHAGTDREYRIVRQRRGASAYDLRGVSDTALPWTGYRQPKAPCEDVIGGGAYLPSDAWGYERERAPEREIRVLESESERLAA